MEDIDGGLHPAVDGQSLDEDEFDNYGILTALYIVVKYIRTHYMHMYGHT